MERVFEKGVGVIEEVKGEFNFIYPHAPYGLAGLLLDSFATYTSSSKSLLKRAMTPVEDRLVVKSAWSSCTVRRGFAAALHM